MKRQTDNSTPQRLLIDPHTKAQSFCSLATATPESRNREIEQSPQVWLVGLAVSCLYDSFWLSLRSPRKPHGFGKFSIGKFPGRRRFAFAPHLRESFPTFFNIASPRSLETLVVLTTLSRVHSAKSSHVLVWLGHGGMVEQGGLGTDARVIAGALSCFPHRQRDRHTHTHTQAYTHTGVHTHTHTHTFLQHHTSQTSCCIAPGSFFGYVWAPVRRGLR